MRCKNCGWDNPDGNVKCEKCAAPITDAMGENRAPLYGFAPDEFSPRATVPGVAGVAGVAGFTPDEFNPRATVTGCLSCGYPVRAADTECPVCGQPVAGGKRAPEVEKPAAEKTPYTGGTIIRAATPDKETEKNETGRKKLVGFLVTYSQSANGEFYPLYEGKNYVGRAASSHVHIKGDSTVSERHLSILYRTVDRKFKFKDEQSSNGTFINGEIIDEGELKNFDMIRTGATELLFIEIPLSSFE